MVTSIDLDCARQVLLPRVSRLRRSSCEFFTGCVVEGASTSSLGVKKDVLVAKGARGPLSLEFKNVSSSTSREHCSIWRTQTVEKRTITSVIKRAKHDK
ncbi:hypothetical protein SDJN03_23332, partial [Cucurbita argyrosperma subsp. sororia]